MIRFSAVGGLIAAAVLMAACSDVSAVPSAPLRAPGTSFDLSNPPPPPLSGGADLSFDASDSFDAGIAADVVGASDVAPGPCRVSTVLHFTFSFFQNPTDNNTFVHLTGGDGSHLVSIHQTSSKLTAHGTIAGDGFSFSIDGANGGSIENESSDGVRVVSVSLSGTLTTTDGATCEATANLTGRLGGEIPQ